MTSSGEWQIANARGVRADQPPVVGVIALEEPADAPDLLPALLERLFGRASDGLVELEVLQETQRKLLSPWTANLASRAARD
jgi:hypothetical protein